MDGLPVRKKTWERRMDEAKQKHRPKLRNWSRDRFCSLVENSRSSDFKRLLIMPSQVVDVLKPQKHDGNLESIQCIDRIDCRNISVKEFIKYYERPNIPLIIKDIPSNEGWNASNAWNLSNRSLFKTHLGQRYFKVGEDDKGYKVKVRMKYFLKYIENNQDDSPLYVFDGNYDDDPVSKSILSDYKVPSYFPDDLFYLVGEKLRPPYRWFLIGPERSGTCVHIDPLGTSAWNTLLQGRKRWVLFPPGTSKTIVKGTDVINKNEDDESINYFVDILPRILKTYRVQCIEFTQERGDTVFVPGGWWHAVLNIQDTIAITQNFCSRTNFDTVWKKTRSGRKRMAVKWLKLLDEHYPDLADRARELNKSDNFEMYDKSKKHSKHSQEHKHTSKKRKKNDERYAVNEEIANKREKLSVDY